MVNLAPLHGGPDAGPEPRYDFSSNANPVGPCPSVLAAIRAADVSRYPDPAYTALRARLADFHGVTPKRIIIGAGASELILRFIRQFQGSIPILGPTFSEYARCAQLARKRSYQAENTTDYLRLRRSRRSLGFVCWPNNPTGATWPLEFVAEAACRGPLVVDLAYAPLCPDGMLARIEAAARHAIRLYAPNKSFGLTGVRAAYAITPKPMPALVHQAPAWVLDKTGEAFLAAATEAEALQWLAASRPLYAAWRDKLALALRDRGCEVRSSPATFLLARVGDARRRTADLRAHGVRVRDCSSFGLPEWIRLSAQPPKAQRYFLAQFDAVKAGQLPKP
jgi:histidinol-phosphate aminotransferase